MSEHTSIVFDSVVDSVTEDLYVIFPLLGRIMRRKLGKIPSSRFDTSLSLSHMKIIQVLHETGTQHVSEVADALFIPRPKMTYLVDRLVKLDLVARSLDPADRRTVNVSLTATGKAMVGEQTTLFRNALKAAVADLSEKEVEQLAESLKKLKELLTKIG